MSNVFDERVEFAVQNLWVIPNVEKSREARRMLEEAANEGDRMLFAGHRAERGLNRLL